MSDTLFSIRCAKGGYLRGINILHGVDLDILEGEAIGILGLNGSGKSSLGKAIINLLPYREGTFIFDGTDVTRIDTEGLANLGIKMMFQGGQVFQTLSVWDNLRLVREKNDEKLYHDLCSIIPLLNQGEKWMKGTMADKLSGGQRHQLALAMTLASGPRIVILDEPSAGLSPKAVEAMYKLLDDVRKRYNLTIILIEQNVARAIAYCDRCLLLQQGLIGRQFSRGEIKDLESEMFNSTQK